MIYVNPYYLQKCDELKDDIEEIKDLWEVNQAISNLKSFNYNPISTQQLIDKMEKKYAKEINELDSMASILSSNRINNSYRNLENSVIHSQHQDLLRIRFAICFKICKKKCFIKCIEEFMDMNQYK